MTGECSGSVEVEYQYTADNRVKDVYSPVAGFLGTATQGLPEGGMYKYDALGRRSAAYSYSRDEIRIMYWKN